MKPSPPDVQLLFRLFNEIGIIAQLSGNAFEKVMPGSLTLPQFSVLNHLTRLGGNRTPLQLAGSMQVTKGAMTNTLGHLEKAGYIRVIPDTKDGRSKRVDITVDGREAHKAAVSALEPELRILAETISPERVAETLPFLEAIRKLLDERRN